MKNEITHFHGRYLSMMERNGWEFVTRSNASAVVALVAVTEDEELILVEQFRKPVEARVIELPAGLVGDHADPDEPILTAAARELEEETGFVAAKLEILMVLPSSAGQSDEMISFVQATGLKRAGPGGGDESEDIKVHVIPLAEIDSWLTNQLATGITLDPKVYSALYWIDRSSKWNDGGR